MAKTEAIGTSHLISWVQVEGAFITAVAPMTIDIKLAFAFGCIGIADFIGGSIAVAGALTALRVAVEASLTLVAASAGRVLDTVALTCLFVTDV